MTTITLTANAKFGQSGQFVARINGRDSKFTFNREFIGSKSGKRGETTSAEVDDPGLYEERDVDSKGRKEDSYVLVYPTKDGGLSFVRGIAKDLAMTIAKRMDAGESIDWRRESLPRQIQIQRERIAGYQNKLTMTTVLDVAIGSLAAGETVTYAQLAEERGKIAERLERELAGEPEPQGDVRAAAIAQIRALMAEHSITIEDLTA